jgi:glycosyltransferase involved in cell wall biosynthesis
MKVTMVLGNDFLYPYLDERVYKEAETLRKEGFDVCVVCWARTVTNKSLDNLPPVSDYKGIKILRVYQKISPTTSWVNKRISQHKKAMRKMAKKVEETKTDIIHYNDFNTLYSVKYGGKRGSTKVVYDSHEDYSLMIESAVPGFLVKMALRLEKRTVKKHVDAVITVSQPILDKLGSLCPENNALVMNCKNLKDYDIPDEKIVDSRKKFIEKLDKKKSDITGDIDDKFILMYIGSLGEHRGLMEVLEVYKSLNTKGNMFLIIGGHGSIEGELKAKIKSMDNAQFIGEVPNEEVPLLTKVCDAVFMMIDPDVESYKFAMPNKLFEAMGAAKPIIASANTLYGEVVKKEDCGVVIPYGDIEALRKTITELAADGDLRSKFGKNAYKAAKREYNWDKQGEKLMAVYNKLIKEVMLKRRAGEGT